MKPVAASPVLREAKAVGRALRGTVRLLARWQAWLLLVMLSAVVPWFVKKWLVDYLAFVGPDSPVLGEYSWIAVMCAIDASGFVLLLALLLPFLEGGREFSPEALRTAGARLAVTAAIFTGLIAVDWIAAGWSMADPLGFLLGGLLVSPSIDIPLSLAEAFVFARVLADIKRPVEWPFRAGHLVVAGMLLFIGDIPAAVIPWLVDTWTVDGEWMVGGPMVFGSLSAFSWDVSRALVGVAAFEYLRGVQADPPAESPE